MVKNEDVVFQVSHWDWHHEEDSNDDDININKYVIRMYGTTDCKKKIFVKVVNYEPYFFVEILIYLDMYHNYFRVICYVMID